MSGFTKPYWDFGPEWEQIADRFEKAEDMPLTALQMALDQIDNDPEEHFQWIRNDPETINMAITYGLRIPKSLFKNYRITM